MTGQKNYSIAIGYAAGHEMQSENSISIGSKAGGFAQGELSIAIGAGSGMTKQADNSIAIGQEAGNSFQRENSIAIGFKAGMTGQGENSVAIGYMAGMTGQDNNSIIINASDNPLNSDGDERFFVKPIRNETKVDNVLFYNNNTGEITYDISSNLSGVNGPTGLRGLDGNSALWKYGGDTDFDNPALGYFTMEDQPGGFGGGNLFINTSDWLNSNPQTQAMKERF